VKSVKEILTGRIRIKACEETNVCWYSMNNGGGIKTGFRFLLFINLICFGIINATK